VELGSEEMTRILKFYAHKAHEWMTRAQTAPAEGHQAYAHRQASIYLSLQARCATLWKDIPAYLKRMQDIIADPRLADPGEFDHSTSSRNRTFDGGQTMVGVEDINQTLESAEAMVVV
jgi:hypothetical protein